MLVPTYVPVNPGSILASDSVSERQGGKWSFKPVVRLLGTTVPDDPNLSSGTVLTREEQPRQRVEPPIAMDLPQISADSAPIQIWEGTVIDVDYVAAVMHVVLNAKMGNMPRHTGEIELEWVAEQDRDLVRPGAVFYLTLFKRTKRSGVQNSQELRFRRRPSWSAAQLKRIEADGTMLRSKMKALPTSA